MIKTLITDVDGVLTTGRFFYDAEGKRLKEFGPHDADGLAMLRSKGIGIYAITADERGFEITRRRCEDLRVDVYLVPESAREAYIKKYDPKTTAFVGDGYHDQFALNYCAESFAPVDACFEARHAAKIVLETPGGSGVLLEVARLLLKMPQERRYLDLARTELGKVCVDQNDINYAADLINRYHEDEDHQIIGIAAGRMGYALRAFIMRLAHLGFNAKMWGDPGVTRCGGNTLVIASTSSGETPMVKLLVSQAMGSDATVLTITTSPESSIAKMSDQLIRYSTDIKSVQPMKTLYEQFTFILFDALVDEIMKDGAFTVADIEDNHSNLE